LIFDLVLIFFAVTSAFTRILPPDDLTCS
jgi:hypothetical protein